MPLVLRSVKGSPLTESEMDANLLYMASHHLNQTWEKAQRGAFSTLYSSAASIAVNLALTNNYVHTMTENTTLAAPTNVVAGQSGVIEFHQHASSVKTLAFNAFWKFPGGAPATPLTATINAVDVMTYIVAADGTYAICTMGKDVK